MTAGPVLIVEDEILVAMDIERILAGAGHVVSAIAADREEAMAAADTAGIAFVDVNLRDGRTGPDIARALSDHGLQVIYITANPAQIGSCGNGALAYVRKPFHDDAILDAMAFAAKAGAATDSDDIIPFKLPPAVS